MRERFEQAIAEGRCGDRLWLYATYHCNLACVYCLTESHPRIADRRTLDHFRDDQLVELALLAGATQLLNHFCTAFDISPA